MRLNARYVFACLLLAGCSIRDPKPPPPPPSDPYAPALAMIREGQTLLRDGDLVLRSGQEFTSQFIRNYSRHDKTYSHSGIVFFENGYPYVFHIVPGDENPSEKMRKDSLERFCSPRKNFGFGIYRYDLDTAERNRFREQIYGYLQRGVRFDSLFNLGSDDRMYCSEMIKKALARSTRDRIRLATTQPNKTEAAFFAKNLHSTPEYVGSLKIVAIDNLFIHPHCRMVKRFDFTSRP